MDCNKNKRVPAGRVCKISFASEADKAGIDQKKRHGRVFNDLVQHAKNHETVGRCSVFLLVRVIFYVGFYNASDSLRMFFIYRLSDTSSHEFSTQARDWVGIMFGVYNAVSALYALSLPMDSEKNKPQKEHMLFH